MPAWLLRLYDMGAESVVVNGPEISKLASITTHPALRQRLYAAVQHNEENHSLITWLMAACRTTWPNKSDIPLNMGLWSSMEDLQNYIRELGKKEAIYVEDSESLDLMKFSVGMWDLIQQQVPPHQYGTLVSILNPLVASEATTGCPIGGRSGGDRAPARQAQCPNGGGKVGHPSATTT